MPYLDNFHHQIVGSPGQPKLVFLHGLLGSAANWRKITSAFEPSFQILIYDQRGHGRSFQPESGYAPEDYADDLKKILDELGWKQITLVGHSMGGRNALNFAWRFPQRITKLVIEDIGPEASAEGQTRILRLLQMVPTPFPSKAEARAFFESQFPRRLKGHSQARILSQYFYTNIEQKPDGTASWRFSYPGIVETLERGRERDRWNEWEGLKVPTLVIRGEFSDELPTAVYERMISSPLVKGIQISGAGHWVHFDKSAEFIATLREFFQESPLV